MISKWRKISVFFFLYDVNSAISIHPDRWTTVNLLQDWCSSYFEMKRGKGLRVLLTRRGNVLLNKSYTDLRDLEPLMHENLYLLEYKGRLHGTNDDYYLSGFFK